MSGTDQAAPSGEDGAMETETPATSAPAEQVDEASGNPSPTLEMSSAKEPAAVASSSVKTYRIPRIEKVLERPARTEEEKEACRKAKRRRYNARKNEKKRAEERKNGKVKKRKTPFVLQYPEAGQITSMANFERVRASVATRIMLRQANKEDLPLSLWSCKWSGWTQPGSAEDRVKAKLLHPEKREGYGEWGFDSATNHANLKSVLDTIVEEMGGKGVVPEPPGMTRRRSTNVFQDDGPTVVCYIPQDVWEQLSDSTDGDRKIRFLMWLETTGDGDFKMDYTSIVYSKMVVSSTGAEEQQLIIKPGENWLKSAAKYPEGMDTPFGKLKFLSRQGKDQKCKPITVSGASGSPDKGETSKKRNRSTENSGRGKNKAKKSLFDEDEEALLSCFESAEEGETPEKGNEDEYESEDAVRSKLQ